MSNSHIHTVRDDPLRYYSMVTKLVHYTSKFGLNEDVRLPKQHSSTRTRLPSTVDFTDRSTEGRRFRLAPIWPEWNESEINNESWDSGNIRKKDTNSVRSRTDLKTNISSVAHSFEDPDGRIELPPSLKVEQWKRPIDFLPSDKSPVIVDSDLGIQHFDLITSNEHLHYSETMRNIVSQVTALWNICRREQKRTSTWRPWEHIYALNRVSKQPFITPYNPSGKYIVRLFFLGTWRKIIIDDSIPFDSQNRCLLPQTTLSHELWPMLLAKALLKVISLDFTPSNDSSESSETSVIHLLTGWIPEPIPLKYTYAEKIWNFLRYDRSNKYASENELPSVSSSGPLPLYKWSDLKVDLAEEKTVLNAQVKNPTEILDDRNPKRSSASLHPPLSRDSTVIKSASIKENRTAGVTNPPSAKDPKKPTGVPRAGLTEDTGVVSEVPMTSEPPKMIVFATMSHSQSARLSSYGETADRSERLRRYNLNETFSTSVLLTTIRDIPLKPPSPPVAPEPVPAWKLIRPRKPKVIPHAEPITSQETKTERWIEIASPYINYPTTSVLNMQPTIRSHPVDINIPRVPRSKKHSAASNPSNIIEVDEDEDVENGKIQDQFSGELVRSTTSISLPTTKKEVLNVVEIHEKSDESTRSAGTKSKRESSIEKNKLYRKCASSGTKVSSETLSSKSKGTESEKLVPPIDVPAMGSNNEQQTSQSTSANSLKKSNHLPKIWMDFDDFCACFTSVIVFHNPRGYQYNHKHTEIKFSPYQPPVPIPITKEKKKESIQPIIQPIPNLYDDKSSMYLFVDSNREKLEKTIELIISLTCLPRWYDATLNEPIVLNEKTTRGASASGEKVSPDLNVAKIIVSQKEIIPQTGSLTAEIYSWKSLSIGQPILRLRTSATKAALLTLPPGRHVLKLTNTCPFAFNLQILSDTNDFMLVDEDQLLNKILSIPEDAEFIIRAEELFFALENSIQHFHLFPPQENKLHELFRFYCQNAPKSIHLTVQTCLNAFHQALYATIRTAMMNLSGSVINAETQFAWRCFTNDLITPDILGAYEIKRPSATSANRHSARTDGRSSANTSKKSGGSKDKSSEDKTKQAALPHSPSISDVQEEVVPDWLSRELTIEEVEAMTSIQKLARGFLQRRMDIARKSGTEKNIIVQRALQSTLSTLRVDFNKSALLLFKNFISVNPQLIQCFSFRNDDWNMVTYQDYNGFYQEQPVNTWFLLFREIFYVTEESFIVAKFLSHLPNSLLRVINNDTYEEMPLVFNRLTPGIFRKNKHGYTFFAEGVSLDQLISAGRFRLRLITSYTHLPEPRMDPITASFLTKEIMDYYLPNKEEIICRHRVIVADDNNQTGRNFHLATIHFSTSKSDVFMRLTIFDHNHEIASVEGKGSLMLPAILFMRTVSNLPLSQPSSRPTSKTTVSNKKSGSMTHRGSVGDLSAAYKDRTGSGKRTRSGSRVGLSLIDYDDKPHKYIIQVTLLRKSWPLTLTQWQFIEQLKEQEKNELKNLSGQQSPTKTERKNSNPIAGKRAGQTSSNSSSTTGKGRGVSNKGGMTSTNRLSTSKGETERTTIDTSKAHWILRVVSDADKGDELTIKKDNERNEELLNMKKAWETFQVGRAEKAMQTRQKFLDSYQIKSTEQLTPEISETTITPSDIRTDSETSSTMLSSIIESSPVMKPTSLRKKSPSSTKKGLSKQPELIPPPIQIDEPLLNDPPLVKSKINLPPLDLQSFLKRKLSSNESTLSETISEQEEFERRRKDFSEYLNYLNDLRQYRENDLEHRSKEKIRQLEEYVDLQARIDQIRRFIHEPHEAYRQRFLEIERQRLQLLAAEQQRLLDEEKARAAAAAATAAMVKPIKKKTSAGKKKKK